MKSLIVEDNPVAQKIMTSFLKKHGETVVASEGQEALRIFQKSLLSGELVDFVCLDILMDGMDGIEVLKAMRALEEELLPFGQDASKIIMITSMDDFGVVAESYESECNGYIMKPVTKDSLEEELARFGFITRKVSIETKSGAKYEGEVKNGKYHGYGVIILPDGAKYEGEWKQGAFSGQGKLTQTDGVVFEGQWENNNFLDEE